MTIRYTILKQLFRNVFYQDTSPDWVSRRLSDNHSPIRLVGLKHDPEFLTPTYL